MLLGVGMPLDARMDCDRLVQLRTLVGLPCEVECLFQSWRSEVTVLCFFDVKLNG